MEDFRWPACAERLAQVPLALDEHAQGEDQPAHDISAAAALGDTLFLAADECAGLEVLHRAADGYAEHRRVELRKAFDLPGGDSEMDIEGVAVCDDWLWIVGSHSLTRKKPKKGRPLDEKGLARLTKLNDNHNRMFLGRMPLRPLGGGRWDVCTGEYDGRRPQMLPVGKHVSPLFKILREHPLIGPFTVISAKENGLDVEGLIVKADRVGLGLRGPVINGWALIVEVEVHSEAGGLELASGLTTHFLDLGGLGIRDLKRLGDEVLILAGPTMKLDGPTQVFRWSGWGKRAANGDLLHHPSRVLELPFGDRCDHPEAMAAIEHEGEERLLVVCDAPGPNRLVAGRVLADVFPLPS
ncbi:MAG: DUF3616 domain-containing protein [Phenylobacterium sp.]|uniref:DUF3616 domain-containing protein n=1 Tax=Phenylobacterium sp. TaxID=1871053 RepID=UPI0027361C88|nr:DUF3616 domain-containing protein [Phenylobacterium sp.]MDP3173319.1 DUF3616 domain-containing protein [Phenylobacterium sp.]